MAGNLVKLKDLEGRVFDVQEKDVKELLAQGWTKVGGKAAEAEAEGEVPAKPVAKSGGNK